MRIKPLILCGGSGSRLWPASRKNFPKQFIPLFKGKCLLELTIERVQKFRDTSSPLIIGSQIHNFFIKDILNKTNFKADLLFEPMPKNTCAAIYLSALYANDDDLILSMPSDHLIPNSKYFVEIIENISLKLKTNEWMTLGIKPTHPSDSYGYIEVLNSPSFEIDNNLKDVSKFIEKPHKEVAKTMILNENFYWNSGIFGAYRSTIIESMEKHAPDIVRTCNEVKKKSPNLSNSGELYFNYKHFKKIPSISIDYAIMEKENNIKLQAYNEEWSDVGSWDMFLKHSQENTNDEKKSKIVQVDSYNNSIISENSAIATIGITDTIIIENDGSFLVSKKGETEKVREIVDKLSKNNVKEAYEHTFEFRPWGKFEILLEDETCKIKRLYISSKKRLSLQYHKKRSEHWTVISGIATVYLDGDIKDFYPGESIDIPVRSHHYLHNKKMSELIIIEIQMGTYFGEDDIIRLDDPYKR